MRAHSHNQDSKFEGGGDVEAGDGAGVGEVLDDGDERDGVDSKFEVVGEIGCGGGGGGGGGNEGDDELDDDEQCDVG